MNLVQEQDILMMDAANTMYKLTFNHIVDLRYILVIMTESEYTASLLIETHIFLLHYFGMLPDFVIFFFCTLINGELHWKTMLKKMSVWLVICFCLPFSMK